MTKQFYLLTNLLYDFDKNEFDQNINKYKQDVIDLMNRFYADIEGAKAGYPTVDISDVPYMEIAIQKLITENKIVNYKPKKREPFICLSHDIDYLYPTFVQHMKKFVGRRNFSVSFNQGQYIQSLYKYLDIDKKYGPSTLFICMPEKSEKYIERFKQWIIDPSYSENDKEFKDLVKYASDFNVDIGVHGSFYSLPNNFLKTEINKIETAFSKKVKLCRQHWLNVSSLNDMNEIHKAGIKIDSSLSWNGKLGFRCGMARPYPLIVNDQIIWELPLLIMDGVLFDELKLNEDEVIKTSKDMLDKVFDINGGVSINWHGRTYSDDYRWGNAYSEILEYAKNKGFKFLSFEEAIKEYE